MLTGSGSPDEFAAHAATMTAFDTAAVELADVEVFQAMFEMHIAGRERSLPPGLHPTAVPTFVVQVWRCSDSPWGAFSLAQGRVGSRSGLRPRGHIQACVCDNEAAGDALRTRWGFPARLGVVTLDRHYDAVDTTVTNVDGDTALAIHGADPDPLNGGDVQYSGSVALAHTPRGLRLVQIEYDVTPSRAERVQPHLRAFDAVRFGAHPSVEPYYPVSASIVTATVTLQPLRFVSRPDELAFTGTEPVTPPA
jgi:hypothetical protein